MDQLYRIPEYTICTVVPGTLALKCTIRQGSDMTVTDVAEDLIQDCCQLRTLGELYDDDVPT